jgi:hypothetical protein
MSAAPPAGVRVVDEASLERRSADAVQSARASLRDTGALLLSLSPARAAQLGALLADSVAVLEHAAAHGPQPPMRASVPENDKLVLRYRLHDPLAAVQCATAADGVPFCAHRFETAVEKGCRSLTGLGRLVLDTLSDAPCEALDGVAAPLHHSEVNKEYLHLFRYEARGSGAGAHTDGGLLTLIVCAAPGLELHTPSGGWQPLHGGAAQVAVLAGDMLQGYATCGDDTVPPALHRVAPGGGEPRHSLVMRLRAPPSSLRPRGPAALGRAMPCASRQAPAAAARDALPALLR